MIADIFKREVVPCADNRDSNAHEISGGVAL